LVTAGVSISEAVVEETLMKRYKQFVGIALAVAAFIAIEVTGFGGWPMLVLAGLVAIALVDGACRQLDRGSAAHTRGGLRVASEPEVKILRPAVQSDSVA
jgi:hypothetical protein